MKKTIEKLLSDSRKAIDNALANDTVKTALAEFGYDDEKLNAGRALHDTARTLYNTQVDEYAGKTAASHAMKQARQSLEKTYTSHIKVARVVFKDNPGALDNLKISGARRKTQDAFLQQTHTFYDQALADETYKTALARFGISETKLNAGKALVTAAEGAYATYQRESGEAQQSTKKRDEALDALEEWMSDFIAISRVALEETPQLLEIMGIVVPS